ncbi:uncharacterized protein LOC120659434 [Panicum virgatum]|uniref:uncharacterized protein LOC120659434 n=1 Tax=Panicum virgatum TaxID=38727 RepID=UPI0019D579E5|nr:uncharacterized protein LOC120659434 [Panicum virgatum]
MGEMVASALAQEGVSRLSSYISTKLDDRASRAHTVARLEMALSRLEFVLEWSRKQSITYVSLIRRWNKFRCAYNEGVYLLNKHKLPALEGHEETSGQVVVTRSSSFLGRIIASAANFSISSLAGLNKQCLSSNVVQIIEVYADSVGEFVADVESACPLWRNTFFPYPFVRQLLQGKYLSYNKVKGSQKQHFIISPVILEVRGIEALLWYEYFDHERLGKSLCLGLVLRLSESTDIVGAAIDCLQSSASLLNLVDQDAVMGELTQVPNLQDIIDSLAGRRPPSSQQRRPAARRPPSSRQRRSSFLSAGALAGLFKKAFELSLLCDAEVVLLVFSPAGKLYEIHPGYKMIDADGNSDRLRSMMFIKQIFRSMWCLF